MTTADHSLYSAHREMLVEHLFLGSVLRELWCRGVRDVEVLKPQVDDAGYDLAIQCGDVLRHIQLKSAHHRARTARVNVSLRLAAKPSGCVIWIVFHEDTMELGPYRWFGGESGQPLPWLDGFKIARHTKGDSSGRKAERPNFRVVPKSQFTALTGIHAVVSRLFGSGAVGE